MMKSLRKGIAVFVLLMIAIGCVTPSVRGSVKYTNIVGKKQANANNTSWRSYTRAKGYDTDGHLFNLKVEAWMATSESNSADKYGYSCRESDTGTATITSSYVRISSLHAIHAYWTGNSLVNQWQEDGN